MIIQFTSSLLIIESIQFILMVVATIILIFAVRERHELYLLLCSYISLSVGLLFSVIEVINQVYTFLSLLFYLLTTLFLFGTVFYEYYSLFLANQERRNYLYIGLVFAIVITVGVFGLEYLILGFLIFGFFLSLYIYSVKETPTYGFFSIIMILGFVSIYSIILQNEGYPWAYELRQGMAIVLASVFLYTAFVAIFEKRMKESDIQYRKVYNKAELYKDLFIHDVSNILQSVLSATEFCALITRDIIDDEKKEELLDLLNTIKVQVNRGADLVSNIESLSKLDLRSVEIKEINLDKQIKKAIDKVKDVFSERKATIHYEISEKSITVKANKILSDLLYNILNNSFSHNNNSEVNINIKVSKKVRSEKNVICVQITDNGLGVSKQIKREINQVRCDKVKTDLRLGLGLIFVCKSLLYYGGNLTIRDRKNDGSKFLITLLEA